MSEKIKLARLHFEMKDGMFVLSKLTDIDTGLIIPIRSIKIELSVENMLDGVTAIIEVPIEEIEMDGVLTKIKLFSDIEEAGREDEHKKI